MRKEGMKIKGGSFEIMGKCEHIKMKYNDNERHVEDSGGK